MSLEDVVCVRGDNIIVLRGDVAVKIIIVHGAYASSPVSTPLVLVGGLTLSARSTSFIAGSISTTMTSGVFSSVGTTVCGGTDSAGVTTGVMGAGATTSASGTASGALGLTLMTFHGKIQ